MKKVLLIALILTFAAGSAIAQQGVPGGGTGQQGPSQASGNFGNPVDRMTELLGLDEAQAESIALIFEDNHALREAEQERARAFAKDLRTSTHAQIMEVLTPDQQVIFDEHQQQREALRQAMKDLMPERGFGGRRGTGDCSP